MTKTHKIILGVVVLTLISLTAVYALNSSAGKGINAGKVNGSAVKSDCGSCPIHKALADKAMAKETCPEMGQDSCPAAPCCCGGDCQCCDGCKGGTCDCEDCQCCDCCKK